MQFLEHVVNLQARLISVPLNTVGRHNHPFRELPGSKFDLLLIRDFLAPLLDEGGILDLFPPIWFLSNRIREGAHLHFYNLIIARLSCQTKIPSNKEDPHRSWVLLALLSGLVLALMKRMYVMAIRERVVNSWPGYWASCEADDERSSTGSRTHISGHNFRRS